MFFFCSSQARGQTSSMFSEMKQLRTEQKKLQDTTLRIEKMLREIGNVEEHVSKKSSMPRDLTGFISGSDLFESAFPSAKTDEPCRLF